MLSVNQMCTVLGMIIVLIKDDLMLLFLLLIVALLSMKNMGGRQQVKRNTTYSVDLEDENILGNNWYRLASFLMNPEANVSWTYFKIFILKSETFEKYLEKHMHKILHLFLRQHCCKCAHAYCTYKNNTLCSLRKFNPVLNAKQLTKLFVCNEGNLKCQQLNPTYKCKQRCVCAYRVKPSISLLSVDITILCAIIKMIDSVDLHPGIETKYDEIRETRNFIFHQPNCNSISNADFKKYGKILINAMEYMLIYIDDKMLTKRTIEKINAIMTTKQTYQDDRTHCNAEHKKRHLEEFCQLNEDRTHEHREKVADISDLKLRSNMVPVVDINAVDSLSSHLKDFLMHQSQVFYDRCVMFTKEILWMDILVQEIPGIGKKYAANMEIALKDNGSVAKMYKIFRYCHPRKFCEFLYSAAAMNNTSGAMYIERAYAAFYNKHLYTLWLINRVNLMKEEDPASLAKEYWSQFV